MAYGGRIASMYALGAVVSLMALAGVSNSVAAASVTETYCNGCLLPGNQWVAQSDGPHTYDDNQAADCSTGPGSSCGSWNTCVSVHLYHSSQIWIPRVCASPCPYECTVYEGSTLDATHVLTTAWCLDGTNYDHHQICWTHAW